MKTHSGAKKRFKITKKGKVMYKSGFRGHMLTKKAKARKRRLRRKNILCPTDAKKIKKLFA